MKEHVREALIKQLRAEIRHLFWRRLHHPDLLEMSEVQKFALCVANLCRDAAQNEIKVQEQIYAAHVEWEKQQGGVYLMSQKCVLVNSTDAIFTLMLYR